MSISQINFKDRIFHSAFYRIIGRIVTVLIAILVTPFLMQHLGEEQYGLWLLIIATVGWARFIDLGFSAAVQRSIAIALEAEDKDRINTIYSCAVVLYSILGLIAAAAIVGLSFFPMFLGVDAQFYDIVSLSLVVLSIKVLWDLGMCCFHGFFSGLLRYDIDANINTANEVLKALGILVLIPEYGVIGAVAATMISDFVTNVYKIFYVRKIYPDFVFDLGLVKKVEFLNLFHYSKHIILLTIAKTFGNNTDLLIISHLLGLTAVAIFGVSKRLVFMVEELYLTVLGMFLPVFTRLMERKDDIREEVEQVFDLNFYLVVVCFIPLIIFAQQFILLWLGEGFEQSRIIVAGLAFSFMCRCISRPVETLLLAKARHSGLSVLKLVQLIVQLVLAVILGSSMGILGVLLATVVSFYIGEVLLMLVLYSKHSGYPVSGLIFKFVRANVLLALGGIIGVYLIDRVSPLSWLTITLYSGLTFIVVAVVCWFLLVDKKLRDLIVRTARSNLNKVSSF